MESNKEEFYGLNRCKCCLEDGQLKDLWAEYMNDGKVEVYGEMLNECFALPWLEHGQEPENICETCIERLRFSLSFKKAIIAAKEVLDQVMLVQLQEGDDVMKKVEYKEEQGSADETMQDDSTEGDMLETEYLSLPDDGDEDYEPDGDTEMQVEYLEGDKEAEKAIKKEHTRQLRGRGKKASYKQYSSEDLKTAVDMVLNEEMTKAEAAEKFGIPLKTLRYKLRVKENDEQNQGKPDVESRIKLEKFYKEIQTVFTYTNMTPYKTRVGRFFCAYCSTSGPVFHNFEQLRIHTRSQHATERLKNIDNIMRPQYLNEILKVDIYKLQCTVCNNNIEDWNSMFQHLKDNHDVDLDAAYSRIVPYILKKDEPTCALCKSVFSHYHLLDCHMNAHYNNYICGECGDSFITEARMKKHTEIHSNERFPCTVSGCDKVFSLDKYRRKHFEGVHLKVRKYRCAYCKDYFMSELLRHQHLLEMHKEEVKTITCEQCNLSFTWRPYYLKHMRLNHTQPDKKFNCTLCPKQFAQKHELRNHMDWHAGEGFTCVQCDKRFSSKNYLQKHVANKHGDDSEEVHFIAVVENSDKIEVGNKVEVIEN